LSELEEEKMNLPVDSDMKLLICWAHSDDRNTSDLKNNDSIKNGGDTSDDGSDNNRSDDEEDQFSDDVSVFD
jgi:hypothetical protein